VVRRRRRSGGRCELKVSARAAAGEGQRSADGGEVAISTCSQSPNTSSYMQHVEARGMQPRSCQMQKGREVCERNNNECQNKNMAVSAPAPLKLVQLPTFCRTSQGRPTSRSCEPSNWSAGTLVLSIRAACALPHLQPCSPPTDEFDDRHCRPAARSTAHASTNWR
jgi:hypothetical protein